MTAAEPSSHEGGGRDLRLAIVVGVLLATLFLGSLFSAAWAFSLVVGGLVVLGVYEATGVLRNERVAVGRAAAIVGATAPVVGAYAAGADGQVAGVTLLFAIAVGDAFTTAEPRRRVVRRFAMTLVLGLWVGFLASFAVRLVTSGDEPEAAVLAVVGAAIFTDIGGYAVGSRLGRHKIAPTISPAKSWEGLVGGLALSAVLAAVVLPNVSETFTAVTAVTIAVLAGLGGFCGDLLESLVKRSIGIKDLGTVLPGHGGILDRVDGILLALPVGYYAFALVT